MDRKPSNRTALLAAYVEAIEAARREGFSWRDLVQIGGEVWGVGRPETLRVMYANAVRAIAAGRYTPTQRPLPGAEPARQSVRAQQGRPTPASPRPAPRPASAPTLQADRKAGGDEHADLPFPVLDNTR